MQGCDYQLQAALGQTLGALYHWRRRIVKLDRKGAGELCCVSDTDVCQRTRGITTL